MNKAMSKLMSMPLIFHAVGEWCRGAVRVARVACTRRIVPEVECAIDAAWERVVTRRPGVKLFDGPMIRLESYRAAPDLLDLSVSPTSYRPFLGTNLTDPTLADRFGADVLANPIGVSTALLTRDGFLMMGRRSAWVAYYPNRMHPFAGALELRDGSTDVFDDVSRELEEELGLSRDDVAEIVCTGLVSDVSLRQPELIFRATTTRTRGQVEAGLDKDEHTACVAIATTEHDVERAIRDPQITPVGMAALGLWGRSVGMRSILDGIKFD